MTVENDPQDHVVSQDRKPDFRKALMIPDITKSCSSLYPILVKWAILGPILAKRDPCFGQFDPSSPVLWLEPLGPPGGTPGEPEVKIPKNTFGEGTCPP
jgi:hypothetical protein